MYIAIAWDHSPNRAPPDIVGLHPLSNDRISIPMIRPGVGPQFFAKAYMSAFLLKDACLGQAS